MDGAVQITPNKFVYYRVYNGEVFLLADDIARAAGYQQRSRTNGEVTALRSDSGIGLTQPRSYLFYEGNQRLFWSKSAFFDFCRRSKETKNVGGKVILDKIVALYESLKKVKQQSTVEDIKAKALRAYIIGDLIHIKFEGEASTKSTKAFTEEAGKYIVKIKKKGYGKYVFNKEDVPKF